ncbi:hypothetical protein L1077_19285 [Pseudoalteromonas luteoviolacea]|uniref:Uncharacterized protein n=1 Tax=Pseudoalteromonas luteoviolacea H33 TaxID=1365251 RepID=A0A167ER65_9GAMM|nr:hypothetical protein [Pseudoalteromonas luteoviolacea]KZN51102.1 hypothetical protein N476_14500 [Pseudoalteromonas luteoviolacea H33]KZN72105.1 hypothetical protein N477_02925 [Pseudoalteromonas luteoviolacea H33-S]MBQ4878487.1 hypothetical protein [Pseudoalteromonas luteoviolacea]MBQ4907642.1 hypothetical protein [Pseudoalteromonas luteoviolacea]MCF6441585.1 hypothetical protein [Pseudoalteromonas luteoviolacea]
MRLKLSKKSVKSLSIQRPIDAKQTPHIAGGYLGTWTCPGSQPCQDKFE